MVASLCLCAFLDQVSIFILHFLRCFVLFLFLFCFFFLFFLLGKIFYSLRVFLCLFSIFQEHARQKWKRYLSAKRKALIIVRMLMLCDLIFCKCCIFASMFACACFCECACVCLRLHMRACSCLRTYAMFACSCLRMRSLSSF